jgi:predicted molibdopterin-dependent oxidoreductase YjgC
LTPAGRGAVFCVAPRLAVEGAVAQSYTTAICRFCHASCGIRVTDRVVHITGDLDNPAYHGYGCIMGRSFPGFHSDHSHQIYLDQVLWIRETGDSNECAGWTAITIFPTMTTATL